MAIKPKESVIPFNVTGSGTGVAQSVVVPGSEHTFETDAYPAFGGQDEHPSPLFYALGALTSCNQVTAALVAKDLGITLGRFEVSAQGNLDTAVLVGGAEGNANFDRVTIDIRVESDATSEQFGQLIRETERRCPVTQLYKRSGLTYESSWEQAALPVAA
ncbi:MAG: OsmC family protein [Solirubrobacteraceae bacterium]|nr:OsmC family protein [Solirubrobacteraceae bacterium]